MLKIRFIKLGTKYSDAMGATVLDAVRDFDAAAADALVAGSRGVTDSRGLPSAIDAPVFGGAIFRLVSARAARAAGDEGSA